MANGNLGPCPHCGQQHTEDVLLCPNTEKLIPLEGRVLDGKFRFVRQLGEGGMGAVWKAENTLVRKLVAIKLMHVQFSRDEGVLARFRNEATAAGRIGSKHICDILDLGRSQLGPYIVMEMLIGSDFADFIVKRAGRVEPGVIVMIVRQSLIGLAAAHGKGIVHRDLKPENIFLHEPEPGRLLVKLMDFGISKFTEGENAGKTGMGVLMGTPEYMSPEQTEGAAQVDLRTDIWAMGVIMYWALAGRNPFVGQTLAATLMNVAAREPPPLEQAAPHLPPGLVAIVSRCIRKRPEERWNSCQELYEALAPFENLAGSPWQPASATAIGSAPPPVQAQSPSALGATVMGGPSQVGATAISSMPPMGPPMGPPGPQIAASAPTMGTRGTPAATGPTWSNEVPNAAPQSAPTLGGGLGSFDGTDDHHRPDRNIGGGGGKGLLIGVLFLVVAAAGGVGWYAMQNKGNTTDKGVAVGKDSGDEAKDSAGEAKDSAGEAKDTAGEAKDTAGEAKDTAGEAKDTAGEAKDTAGATAGAVTADTAGATAGAATTDAKATGDTPDPTGDTPDPSGGTPDPSGGTPDPTTPDPTTPDPTGDTPDPTGDTPDPTAGGNDSGGGDGGEKPDPKKPPPPKKVDKTKVREVGKLYVATDAKATASFDAATSHCAKLSSSKYANLKGWRIMSKGEASSVAGRRKGWVGDKEIWDGIKVTKLLSKTASQTAFCVVKK